jgi:hypothetical protein
LDRLEVSAGDRLKFIGCEVLYREACCLAAASRHQVDVEFLPKGLHDLPTAEMRGDLQRVIDAAAGRGERPYKAILLGYARCSDGVVGLKARSVPLVIPKAHDCITLFFGSRRAYQEYFDCHVGTYFHTSGWLERNNPRIPGRQGINDRLGLGSSLAELSAKYGADNAQYILETLGDGLQNYRRVCYIEMGTLDEAPLIRDSQQRARERGWEFENRRGDWSLLRRLFEGPWAEDFLVVPPGGSMAARNDGEILGLAGPGSNQF